MPASYGTTHTATAWCLDPQIAYLTGDFVPGAGRVQDHQADHSVGQGLLRKALHALDCGTLEILVRGLDVDPDALRSDSNQREPDRCRWSDPHRPKGVAFICEPGVRGGQLAA